MSWNFTTVHERSWNLVNYQFYFNRVVSQKLVQSRIWTSSVCPASDTYRIVSSVNLKWKKYSFAFPLQNKLSAEDCSFWKLTSISRVFKISSSLLRPSQTFIRLKRYQKCSVVTSWYPSMAMIQVSTADVDQKCYSIKPVNLSLLKGRNLIVIVLWR